MQYCRLGFVIVALLSLSLISTPVYAHFTLGNLIAVAPYHENDSDPHVPGPTVYLWPGAGAAAYSGTPNAFPSGYEAPYTVSNQPAVAGYSPFGAILTSTIDHKNTGPLILAINFSNPCAFGWNDVDNTCLSGAGYKANYTGVTVYIPPEFDLSALAITSYNPGLIQTTFGANANDIAMISRASSTDPWGPGWWIISMYGDIHWWPQHDYREWYYMRINDVVAPKIAGKYFFKVFLNDQFFNFVYPGMPRNLIVNGHQCAACNEGPASNPSYALVPYSGPTNATVPVENWPIVLVKGEIDPAVVTGTIRYGSFNETLYGNPIDLPGRVRAVGVAIDPYQPSIVTTGRAVEARGYFNASGEAISRLKALLPESMTFTRARQVTRNSSLLPKLSFFQGNPCMRTVT